MALSVSEDRLLIAAIDFGTTFSGYAFATRDDLIKDPPKTYTPYWNASDGSLISFKTPTTVLLDNDENLVEFGFDAETAYAELADEGQHLDHFYFRRFKMMLYDKVRKNRLTTDVKVADIMNKELPAVKVFSHAIKYLKDHLLTSLKTKGSIVTKEEITWVLTVPAIWDDPAKLFMRKAAQDAGIPGHQLIIALEPEAASIYCKHLPVEKLEGADEISVFQAGSKYLVLDAGGGTVDITVHEVKRDGNLQELDRASGGDWGGISVDQAFKDVLIEIAGEAILEGYCQKYTGDYIELFRDFEIKKRFKHTSGDDPNKKITLKIPATFTEECEELLGTDLTTLTNRTKYKNHLHWGADKLRIDVQTFQSFFQPACEGIVKHVRELLQSPRVRGTNKILMVGGFSESIILQDALKTAFPECRVIVPQEAGLSVLRGAVLFGKNPSIINARIAKYTYGVNTSREFNPTIHKLSKKKNMEGKDYCNDLFSIHAKQGDTLVFDEAQAEKSYSPIYTNQKKISFKVYTSKSLKPKYIDDPGCECIGSFSVNVPLTGPDRSVKTRMIFGGTEIKVEARVSLTGELTTAEFNLPEEE